jgi:hypothetical protein
MPYDPTKSYLSGEQYIPDPNYLSPELSARVEKDVITICNALGYDLNTVEFAIKDGIPYAIDFMNPAPDAELASVGEYNHNWIVNEMTDFILKKLKEGFETPEYRWTSMLNPAAKAKGKAVAKAKTMKAAAKTAKKPTEKKSSDKKASAK